MKKLILDYSVWRSGQEGDHSLGEGETMLLNDKNFMCCLGQFSLQLGASKKMIIDCYEPNSIRKAIKGLAYRKDHGSFTNTKFSDAAIDINDTVDTTPAEKITLLTALCAEHGYELEVINEPEKEVV